MRLNVIVDVPDTTTRPAQAMGNRLRAVADIIETQTTVADGDIRDMQQVVLAQWAMGEPTP